MAATTPLPFPRVTPEEEWAGPLQDALDALAETTGAAAGCIGLLDADGRPYLAARHGAFRADWLGVGPGRDAAWGFVVREGPAVVNNLPPLPLAAEPPLDNLLGCAVGAADPPAGQILLANKPGGFTALDEAAVNLTARWLGKHIARRPAAKPPLPASLLRLVLDRLPEGILLLDPAGQLLFANATWAEWSGYRDDELAGRWPPFPFWVSPGDLARLRPGGPLPFRHRNHSLFWCRMEIVAAESPAGPVLIARLHPAAPDDRTPRPPAWPQTAADNLPFALALTDGAGRLVWANRTFSEEIRPAGEAVGQALAACFGASAAGALAPVLCAGSSASGAGSVLLRCASSEGEGRHFLTNWRRVHLPEGPGLLLAFAEDWGAVWSGDDRAAPSPRVPGCSEADWLALLLRPGGAVEFWDERWERLTGLTRQDVAGAGHELLLDWLFPEQPDREFVADVLHQPDRSSAQAMLAVAGRNRSRALLCTFLPLATDAWLILACDTRPGSGPASDSQHALRGFARGLARVLDHDLSGPLGQAATVLGRADLPAETAAALRPLVEGCAQVSRLAGSLRELAAAAPEARQRIVLASLVREVLDDYQQRIPVPAFELAAGLRDPDASVEADPRMLKVVLHHLLRNAVQALLRQEPQRIEVRVYADEAEVCCEVRDTGEGLPTADWETLFCPFHSTKGPFAQEAAHAALEAAGLGLAVSRHLVALHGGQLEFRRAPGRGTTARLVWPRARGDAGASAPASQERLRTDGPASASGPHTKEAAAATVPPPRRAET